jgi:CHAT domain-containing protein
MTENNLANAYKDRIHGSRADNLETAIHHYQQALEVRTRAAFPIEHRTTLKNLVTLYFDERRWQEGYQTCLAAITVGADIFAAGIGDAGRMEAIKQTGDLYTRAAYSAIQQGQFSEALTLLESGKTRLLSEWLSLGDAHLVQLDDAERSHLQTLREQIRTLEYEYRLPTAHPTRRTEQAIRADLGEARTGLRALIDTFRMKYPNFMPEGLPLGELLALIPTDGALVAPLFTSQGSAVFIVPSGLQEVTAAQVLLLDDFKLADIRELTRGPADDPEWGGWLGAYFTFKRNGNEQTLFDGIDDVTHRLWDALVRHLHESLQGLGVKRILFMPHGDSALVPLHAAWREVEGVRRYFIDDYRITYTPSMVTLANARRRSSHGAGALVAGVSTYQTMNPLPNTRAEADSIASLLGTNALLDDAATVNAIREGVQDKTHVHLSCHGGFGWGDDAFSSVLVLTNDELLPLSQIIAHFDLSAAHLVVLSACETGIIDVRNIPDEFVGLATGFMQAGAAAVVSSLWSVDDRSTALLMERMYKLMLDKDHPCEPAEALRQAQFWLRKATTTEIGNYYQSYLIPRMSHQDANDAYFKVLGRFKLDDQPYAHPFYWAAFTYSGL